jgi:hypothetical protein
LATNHWLVVVKGASTICIDLRTTDLEHDAMAYIKKACNSIAEEVTDGKAPERRASDDGDGDGGWFSWAGCPRRRWASLRALSKYMEREAQHQAAHAASMGADR